MATQAVPPVHDGTEPWFGFNSGLWNKEIDAQKK